MAIAHQKIRIYGLVCQLSGECEQTKTVDEVRSIHSKLVNLAKKYQRTPSISEFLSAIEGNVIFNKYQVLDEINSLKKIIKEYNLPQQVKCKRDSLIDYAKSHCILDEPTGVNKKRAKMQVIEPKGPRAHIIYNNMGHGKRR